MTADVYVSGVSAWLPDTVCTVEEAVAQGRYDADRAATDGFTSVCIEQHLSPPEMALRAARPLLRPEDASAINSLYLCSIHRHGHKLLWPPASYLHRVLELDSRTRVMSLNQGCNGGFTAVSLAYDLIRAGLPGDQLVVGADRFSGSAFDRFNSDLGTLYGDAAFALRLSAAPGAYRIACLELESEPALEPMYRAVRPEPEGPGDHDVKSAKKAYLEAHGREGFNALFIPALQRLRRRLLETADLETRPADYVIYPNVGAGLSARLYAGAFADLARQDMWGFGRSIGHTGTADQFLGLWELGRRQVLRKHDRVLMIGAGNGLGLAAMLLEKT